MKQRHRAVVIAVLLLASVVLHAQTRPTSLCANGPAPGPGGLAPASMRSIPSTQRANAMTVVGAFPADLPPALAGAWRMTAGVDATYRFDPDGSFTLTFPAGGQASGTWKIDGKRLVMINRASTTPFSIVGETKDAEIAGIECAGPAHHKPQGRRGGGRV